MKFLSTTLQLISTFYKLVSCSIYSFSSNSFYLCLGVINVLANRSKLLNFRLYLCCYLEALVGGSWILAWYTHPPPSESATMLNSFFEEESLGAQENNPPVCFQMFHIYCWVSQTSFYTLCLKSRLSAKFSNPLKFNDNWAL